MLQTLRLALCAITIAAGCGGGDDGDGNGPPPDGNDEVECGDGTCTDGLESYGNCPEDCPPVVNCGNGACDGNEDCTLCAADCGECPETCGDGRCTGDETNASCAQDCPLVVDCGNGACDSGEDCATCAADCACTGGQLCRSWEALGLAQQCGMIPEDPTSYCGSTCGPANPLIDAIPGSWSIVEPPGGSGTIDVLVDPSAPACDIPGHEAGDACVLTGGLELMAVLDGTRLFLESPPSGYSLEGQVLEEGRRLEYDEGPRAGRPFSEHFVWVKE